MADTVAQSETSVRPDPGRVNIPDLAYTLPVQVDLSLFGIHHHARNLYLFLPGTGDKDKQGQYP
jgi:hypothetical protein